MFHVKHEVLGAVIADLSPRQREQLDAFEALLLEPGVARGVIARGDADRVGERHIADSMRAVPVLRGSDHVCDLGSGGGLPGVPLAVARPDIRFVLAERRANRADFLRIVVRSLRLGNVEVHEGDALALEEGSFGAVVARAFGDARRSWAAAQRLLRGDGALIYWAGASFDMGRDLPDGLRAEVLPEPPLAGSGPLVIMSRQ